MISGYRIGFGYDLHPLKEGGRLVLGGVDIPFDSGLDGWSDADVLTHAMMDALLGAAALGDIGKLFPPGDEQYQGISSIKLLAEVVTRLHQENWGVANVDATILADEPKLAPYIDAMRQKLAAVMGLEWGCVSVKASTSNGLGIAPGGGGIAAHAVALISLNENRD